MLPANSLFKQFHSYSLVRVKDSSLAGDGELFV